MKTILLLRHAKSDWSDPSLVDFDRPLANRGLKDAPRMGDVLAGYNFVPDIIISSPARRAKQTAKHVAEACGYTKSIQWQESFYGATSDALISSLQQLNNRIDRPLLVGHNPTMEETVAELLTDDGTGAWTGWFIRIPTAGLVCLDVDIVDWATLDTGMAVLRWFLIPKLVKAIT